MTITTESHSHVRRSAPWAPLVAIAVITGVAFVGLALVAGHQANPTTLDTGVMGWFADHRTNAEGQVGLLLAHATTPVVLIAGTLIAAAVLWRRGLQYEAATLAFSVAAAYVLGGAIKAVLHRARPDAPWNLAPEAEGSFPSGHVLVVSTIAFVALVLAWSHLGRRGRVIGSLLAFLAVFVMSVDRLLVGAHWLTDVLASILLAGLIAVGAAVALALKPASVNQPDAE